MYHFFRSGGVEIEVTPEEVAVEMGEATVVCEGEDTGAATAAGVDGVESTCVATLTDELRPESISRFNLLRSPRISDAT
jgi:hypothetical protein